MHGLGSFIRIFIKTPLDKPHKDDPKNIPNYWEQQQVNDSRFVWKLVVAP